MNWFRRLVRAVQFVRADNARRRKLAAVLHANPGLTPPAGDDALIWLLDPTNPASPLNPSHPNYAATDAAVHASHAGPTTHPTGHHDAAATQPAVHHAVHHDTSSFGGGFDAGPSHSHH